MVVSDDSVNTNRIKLPNLLTQIFQSSLLTFKRYICIYVYIYIYEFITSRNFVGKIMDIPHLRNNIVNIYLNITGSIKIFMFYVKLYLKESTTINIQFLFWLECTIQIICYFNNFSLYSIPLFILYICIYGNERDIIRHQKHNTIIVCTICFPMFSFMHLTK